ncbi:MAG: glucosamine-6-phosphate deaminase [Chryseolinea sp.]
MNLRIFEDYSHLSRATADLILSYLKAKPTALVCLASGHTPRGVFEYLVDDVKNNRLDLSQCTFVSLDEWVGIPPSQKGSCRAMMDEDFFWPLGMEESQIVFFDGMGDDPESEAFRINNVIAKHGGLDIMLVGVGTNGHIAMNEPGTSFDREAHVSELAEETKTVGQKYFSGNTVLSNGITLGLKHFQDSKLPILMANGLKKTNIIKKLLTSSATESLPASIVHNIPGAFVMIDREAADN